ncbi:MAG: ribulokinase [Bacteroidales bacterium]|jgi:L-ribulokinase|nr:ribulokinase [Bacteroidales bacterium]
MDNKLVIGVDYGTDSCRALLVDIATGKELATSVMHYPRWSKGLYCDPGKNQYRQHPLDYIESLEYVIRDVLSKNAGYAPCVKAISIDTTGSTPVAVNQEGVPLALLPRFAENPNAMFVLWKDHTAVAEADEINRLAHQWDGVDYTRYSGGIYSSEWFWAKLLHVLRDDPEVGKAAFSWMEHSDWMPALLCGKTNPATLKRNRCTAGHKAMWHEEWGGFPAESFFAGLHLQMAAIRKNMNDVTVTSDHALGTLTQEWADRLGLNPSVLVGVGALDAHIGAVGGGIKPYYLSKVIGTSTCDMLVAPLDEMKGIFVKGICGQVDGSIIPNMLGMEAGQSAFGDIYAWLKKLLMWPVENILEHAGSMKGLDVDSLIEEISAQIIPKLTEEAGKIELTESSMIALDWMNGRRTPDANQTLRGAIAGLTLGTDAPRIFRALVEATAFGSKAIVDRFMKEGVRIDGIIALGGVAQKSPFTMHILSDVIGTPIKVAASEQTCALGAAMCAAVVAGGYPTVADAQKAMGQGFACEYVPNMENHKTYMNLYQKYLELGRYSEKLM